MTADRTEGADTRDSDVLRQVERQHEQRERAAREPAGSLWRTVAQVGTLGWLIALPPVVGAFSGHLLDMRLDSGITCALALMTLGLAVGAYFFWQAVRQAGGGQA